MPLQKFKANIAEILKRGYIGASPPKRKSRPELLRSPQVRSSVHSRIYRSASVGRACVVTQSPMLCRCRSVVFGIAIISTSFGTADSRECLDRGRSAARSSLSFVCEKAETWHRILVSSPPFPAGVKSKIDGQSFTAKGARGTDSTWFRKASPLAGRRQRDHPVPADDLRPTQQSTAWLVPSWRHGQGVHEGYAKTLEIVGTGYRAQAIARTSSPSVTHTISTVEPPPVSTELPNQPGDRQGHRQTGCRPVRRQHPQASRSGTLQGQGHQVLG